MVARKFEIFCFLKFCSFLISFLRVVTHNNDCQDCDLRITKVPPRDWPEGELLVYVNVVRESFKKEILRIK
jgi:hypothetical protein